MRKIKRFILFSIIAGLLFLLFTFIANRKIENESSEFISSSVSEVPVCNAALVLGTGKYLKSGRPNLYFTYRIDATAELYRNGKMKYVIVSGDNSRKGYNEPKDMLEELVKAGVPDSVIYLDYAGFRTFDSMIRVREIFRQTKIIVVSQKFHNERAVYIGRNNEIEAFGFNARDVTAYSGRRTRLREFFARAKVFADKLIGRKPKFLGEPVILGVPQQRAND